MAETYKGGCHCGKVRYEVKLDLNELISCNCSICAKTASILAFVPAQEFKLLSGEDALTDYQFGKKHVHHLFCSTCGIRSFGSGEMPDGRAMRAINVRCLEGVNVDTLKITPFDGKSL
ncbi:GFA family protein [Hyalangium rubrum]|uniref:GFA family protein n=1 Tax=Hyalangium rubrum TaxID=3103134 RepID=A0ABU5H2M5_9BACT|nr:GFA family protein [Hyalangium sp. s54d21]MDY7227718.1 GFA family protein [Hyalangium sp. s54d21]